jgi:hypothetical protein
MPAGGATGFYLLLCAGAALWIDLGTLHRLQHGDSLLPVLVSLQRWTPFFWEQDRYGMLIPWLVQPVRHPFWNLLAQGFLNVFCGLAAFFLLARYLLRDPAWPLVGCLGAVAFLTLAPAPYRFDYLMDANYGVWMSLGLGGLIVAEPAAAAAAGAGESLRTWGRRLVALGLIGLAHWAYSAAVLYLGSLVVFQVVLAPGFRQTALERLHHLPDSRRALAAGLARAARSGPGQALLMLIVGFLAAMRLASISRHQQTSYARLALVDWPGAWAQMIRVTWQALAPGAWPIGLSLAAGLVVFSALVLGRPRPAAIPWREAAALIATALVVALFLGTRRWLKINDYVPRYLIPSALLVQAALAMVIVVPLSAQISARGRRTWPALIGILLLASAAWAYGLPSVRRVRADLDRFGRLTPDVLAAGCTHIAGNYWTVWPAVFHVNLTLYERGESRTIWGVTFRGQPASERWRGIPLNQRCACIEANDPYGDNWLLSFGMTRFRDVARRQTVRVLRRLPDPPEPGANP